MSDKVCLVHYHEIGLKGKNRSTFENQLVVNLRRALQGFDLEHVGRISGHLLVSLTDDTNIEQVADAISKVPGVARVSLAYRTTREPEVFCEAAVAALKDAASRFSAHQSPTFKVQARKSNTDIELHTLELNRLVGSTLCAAFPELKVDVHNPDIIVHVNIVQGSTYVYAASEVGVGGLPVGTAGKVVTLLSSGFDSPVATWMVGRRGATCIPIHFSGRPMTSDESEWLCQDIVHALQPSGIIGRMYVVPFGEVQREISLAVPQALRVIMYRRMMFKIAERVARLEGAKALVTGESLGQVASQTLDNIAAVNEVVDLPIFRPLIGSDKQEIILRAQQIGTYDISCQTAPDCCTLFMPRRPETHAKLDQVHEAWELFDHEGFIDQLMQNIEYIDAEGCPSYHPPKELRRYHSELGPASWTK